MGRFEMQPAVESGLTSQGKVYAQIIIKANNYIQLEHHFRVSFWALVANFSGLALGINSTLTFLMRYLNLFEKENVMITELYKQQN